MGPQAHSFESIFTLGLCLLLGIPKLTVWKPAVRQLALSSSPLFPQNSAHTKSSFCSVRSISSPRSISLLSTSYIPIAIRYMKLIDTQRIKLSPSIPQVPWVHSLPFFLFKDLFLDFYVCLCPYECMPHVCRCLSKPKGVRSLELALQAVECQGLNSASAANALTL